MPQLYELWRSKSTGKVARIIETNAATGAFVRLETTKGRPQRWLCAYDTLAARYVRVAAQPGEPK
jgi:hypothetical protein